MSGRIPQRFIQDLLARTDIVEVIGTRLQLKRAGREYKALSPFTNEKSPSFFVNPTKQFFHCFSSGKSGNAIGFLMEYERLSFREAVEDLAQRAGLEVPSGPGGREQLVLEGPLDACAAAERFFREQFDKHPAAQAYARDRGLSRETLQRFGIGYAPDAWDALTRFFGKTDHALAAGLLIERDSGGSYDRFRHRLMFPIRDTRGRVIAFGGRTLGNDPAKYLNSPETPLFHKGRNLFGLYEAKQAQRSALNQLIVVEGYMDVVMLSQHGVSEAVATLGTATTAEHLTLLYRSTRRVVFCFDGDRAGRAAAWRALEQALPEVWGERECLFAFLPDGHDPDSLVREIGEAAFRERLSQSQTLTGFLLSELEKQVNLSTIDGRAKLAALAAPHLEKMRDGPLKTLLVDALAERTRLRREDIVPPIGGEPSPVVRERPPSAALPPAAQTVRRALQLLLEQPTLAEAVTDIEVIERSAAPGLRVLTGALTFFHEHPDAHPGQLIEAWRGTREGAAVERVATSDMDRGDLGATLADRLAAGHGTAPQYRAGIEREFLDCIDKLRQMALRVRIDELLAAQHERGLSDAEKRELGVLTLQRSQSRSARS